MFCSSSVRCGWKSTHRSWFLCNRISMADHLIHHSIGQWFLIGGHHSISHSVCTNTSVWPCRKVTQALTLRNTSLSHLRASQCPRQKVLLSSYSSVWDLEQDCGCRNYYVLSMKMHYFPSDVGFTNIVVLLQDRLVSMEDDATWW